jgi:hypothetical protein
MDLILHLGEDAVVPMEDIIAIIDIKSAEKSAVNQEFLHIAKEEGFSRSISEDAPKSIILAEINKKTVLLLSPISSATLLKRSRLGFHISDNKEVHKQENKGETK